MVDISGMSGWIAIAKMIDERGKPEGRTCPRFIARNMSCAKSSKLSGTVQDFSASGLRVLFSKCPRMVVGDRVNLDLESESGIHHGEVEVVRVDKLGFRKCEVGFKFVDPEAAKKMRLFKSGYNTLEDGFWSAA